MSGGFSARSSFDCDDIVGFSSSSFNPVSVTRMTSIEDKVGTLQDEIDILKKFISATFGSEFDKFVTSLASHGSGPLHNPLSNVGSTEENKNYLEEEEEFVPADGGIIVGDIDIDDDDDPMSLGDDGTESESTSVNKRTEEDDSANFECDIPIISNVVSLSQGCSRDKVPPKTTSETDCTTSSSRRKQALLPLSNSNPTFPTTIIPIRMNKLSSPVIRESRAHSNIGPSTTTPMAMAKVSPRISLKEDVKAKPSVLTPILKKDVKVQQRQSRVVKIKQQQTMNKKESCPVCKRLFSSNKELADHISSQHYKKDKDCYRCCLCGNRYGFSYMINHVQFHLRKFALGVEHLIT